MKWKVSYGELSADEVDAVITMDTASRGHISDNSAVDDADLSSHSLCHRGRVLFVDDEASEGEALADGASEGDASDNSPDAESAAESIAVWFVSSYLFLTGHLIKPQLFLFLPDPILVLRS